MNNDNKFVPNHQSNSSDFVSKNGANQSKKKITFQISKKQHKLNKNNKRKRGSKNKAVKKGVINHHTELCAYYIQGNCQNANCTYSHDVSQTVKPQVCKFFTINDCVKGDKCLYMHSNFPCKFYHTGVRCPDEPHCKYYHGSPISDDLKETLLKIPKPASAEQLEPLSKAKIDEVLRIIDETYQKRMKAPEEDRKNIVLPPIFNFDVPIPIEVQEYMSRQKPDSEP